MSDDMSYAPGPWTGICAPRLWGLALIAVDDPRLPDLVTAVGQGLDEVLDALTRHGIRSLPGFVFVSREPDGLRYAVRAPAALTVDDVRLTVSSGGPWSGGHLGEDVARLELSDPASPTTVMLPISGGVAAVCALVVLLGASSPSDVTPRVDQPANVEPTTAVATETSEPSTDQATSSQSTINGSAGTSRIAEEALDAEQIADEVKPLPGIVDPPQGSQSGDQSAAYYELLVSSTVDLEALRAKLGEPQTDNPESTFDESTGLLAGATGVWSDEPDDVATPPEDPPPATARPDEMPDPSDSPTDVIDGVPWAAERSGDLSTPKLAALPAPPNSVAVDATQTTTNRAALLAQLAQGRPVGPRVPAVRCGRGHLSPPYAVACRVCGAQLAEQEPQQVLRPPLGRLTLSNGSSVLLDRSVVFGRSPESQVSDPADRPHLVRLVESGEISRMHASVTLDGWQVFVRDLSSQNGTFVTLPGGEPEQIRPHQDYGIEAGSVVSLADVVTFTFEIGE